MKVLVVYHSRRGHVLKLARAVMEGVGAVEGIEGNLCRVQEFEDAQQQIARDERMAKVWAEQKDIPVCTLNDLREAQGVIFGSPTRYGNMSAQMKRLIDSTGGLWVKGEMEGKPAGIFTSTSTTHGGQETTALTMMPPLLHLGMIIVGVPYSIPGMQHTEGRGGSPYSASTVAGPNDDLFPTPEDLTIAKALGQRVAEITRRLRE